MVRVLGYVAIVFLIAAGFAWLADRPGGVVLTWQGYEIRTSLMAAAIAAAVLLAAIAIVGAVLRAILNAPRAVGHYMGARRRDRGWRALSRGMIAVGAGDVRLARRSAEESRTLLGGEPLALLLSAQAAQLAGDGNGARASFEALAAKPETKLLGLHGLFVEAQRQGEREAARHFAEEAVKAAPRIGWAGTALFDFQSQAGDWVSALKTLSSNVETRIVDKAAARRLRAVLLTARAMELESGEPEEAKITALEAHRLAPELVPSAAVAARLLTRLGDIKRASKVLETTWKAAPHPEIAEAYASVRPGDSVRDRLKRVRRLADMRANNPEGAIALARAAIDAREWDTARKALAGLANSAPSERVCMLMAEIEEGEFGDQGRVRGWLTRAFNAPRDPTWVADGQAFERWAPVSPISGRVDAFEWKALPQALPRPAVEQEEEVELSRPPSEPAVAVLPASDRTPAPAVEAKAAAVKPVAPPPPATLPAPHARNAPSAESKAPKKPEPALARAPDDPGPDAVEDERFRVF
jgi:HemY protein